MTFNKIYILKIEIIKRLYVIIDPLLLEEYLALPDHYNKWYIIMLHLILN